MAKKKTIYLTEFAESEHLVFFCSLEKFQAGVVNVANGPLVGVLQHRPDRRALQILDDHAILILFLRIFFVFFDFF